METRLTDLIRRQSTPPISAESIERVYQRCLQDGTPLGEALVSSGVISAECLRAVLCQHTAEGLAALSRCGNLSPKWVPCLQQRYDPRFTFSTAELLARVGALLDENLAARAQARLIAAVDGTNPGAAFPWLENLREPLPISQVHGERVGVLALTELGRWAMDALTAGDRLVSRCRVVVSTTTTGEAVVAWREESVVYVALCDVPIAMHRTITKWLRMLKVAD